MKPEMDGKAWGPIRKDCDFAIAMRRKHEAMRKAQASGARGPIGMRHDVGDGRMLTVAEIASLTGCGRKAIDSRIRRGIRGSDLLAVRSHGFVRRCRAMS